MEKYNKQENKKQTNKNACYATGPAVLDKPRELGFLLLLLDALYVKNDVCLVAVLTELILVSLTLNLFQGQSIASVKTVS